jgi:hypothetical protein
MEVSTVNKTPDTVLDSEVLSRKITVILWDKVVGKTVVA